MSDPDDVAGRLLDGSSNLAGAHDWFLGTACGDGAGHPQSFEPRWSST